MRKLLLLLLLLLPLAMPHPASADSAEQIRRGADEALAFLRENVDGAGDTLSAAAGVLVFPDVVKLGFGVGGEYGEGVLLVADEPSGYYATSGAAFGLPPGSQLKSSVVVFTSDTALQSFLARRSWRVGDDGLVPAIAPAPAVAGGTVAYVFSEAGLVPGLTLDGARFTRLAR